MYAVLLSVLLSADVPVQSPAPAKVVVTAELACLHCDFGVEGDGCAVCLKLDAKTPVLLEGKVADGLTKSRFDGKTYVLTGKLTVKDKNLVLTPDEAHLLGDADKGKAPAKGEISVTGTGACAACDLKICEACALAVLNDKTPIILDGAVADKHAHAGEAKPKATATGKISVDKNGVLRLTAKTVDVEKK